MLLALKSLCQSGISIEAVKIKAATTFPSLNQKIEFGKDSCVLIKEFSNDGNVRMTGKWKSLESKTKDGRFTYFNDSMKPIVIGTYSNDMPIGVWQYFDNNGNILNQLNYSKVLNFMVNQEKVEGFYFLTDKLPEFKTDNYNNFSDYLMDNIIFPINAIKENVNENVAVSFIINTEGRLVNAEIVKGQNLDLNMEILRVLIESPQWTPGKDKKGIAKNIKFTYPIRFQNNTFNLGDYNIVNLFEVGYTGGALQFRKDIAEKVNYPDKDKKKQTFGISISKVEFLNNGEVLSVNTINSLSEEIDQGVKLILKELLNDKWNPVANAPDTLCFYMPVIYKFGNQNYDYLLKLNTNKIMDEVYVTAYGLGKSIDIMNYQTKINQAKETEHYEEIIQLTNDILKFDPLNVEIRKLAIECWEKLGEIDKAETQSKIMQNYIDNKSIDELLIDNTP